MGNKLISAVVLVVLFLICGVQRSDAGVVKTAAKAGWSVTRTGARIGSYPVRHPKRSAHGVGKAARAAGRAAY